jgi:hypothetical protein
MTTWFDLTPTYNLQTYNLHNDNNHRLCYFPMSFKLHNEKKFYFECKGMAYTILGIAFCYIGRYGGDFLENFGSRFLDTTSLCLCFSFFFFSWPMEWYKFTSMHSVHNATHLLMNKVTHS